MFQSVDEVIAGLGSQKYLCNKNVATVARVHDALVKASASVLNQDKELLVFPLVSMGALALVGFLSITVFELLQRSIARVLDDTALLERAETQAPGGEDSLAGPAAPETRGGIAGTPEYFRQCMTDIPCISNILFFPVIHFYGFRCRIIDEDGREIRRAVTCYKDRILRRYTYRRLLRQNLISQPATNSGPCVCTTL